MKYTSGPWQTDLERSFGNNKYSVLDNEGWRVAWVDERNDARLIAAAPDLLEALETCVDTMNVLEVMGKVGFTHANVYKNALEAIKKARGL